MASSSDLPRIVWAVPFIVTLTLVYVIVSMRIKKLQDDVTHLQRTAAKLDERILAGLSNYSTLVSGEWYWLVTTEPFKAERIKATAGIHGAGDHAWGRYPTISGGCVVFEEARIYESAREAGDEKAYVALFPDSKQEEAQKFIDAVAAQLLSRAQERLEKADKMISASQSRFLEASEDKKALERRIKATLPAPQSP